MPNHVSLLNNRRLEILNSWLPARLDKLSPGKIDAVVDSLNFEQLAAFLNQWIDEHRTTPMPARDDMRVHQGEPCILDSRFYPSAKSLARLALYAGCIVIPDPLLEHAFGRMLIGNQIPITPPDRREVAEAIRRGLHFYKEHHLALVEGVIFPTSTHTLEAATTIFPGYWAPDAESLARLLPAIPEEIMTMFDTAAQVYPYDSAQKVVRTDRRPIPGETATIAIDFQGDEASPYDVITVQHFIQKVGFSFTANGDLLFIRNTAPATESEMEQWIKSAVRASAVSRLFELLENVTFADSIGGTLFTVSDVHYSVLERLDAHGSDSQEIYTLGDLDLPFLADVSLEQIVRARQDSELFEDFRIAFRNACGKLKADRSEKNFPQELRKLKTEFFDQARRRLDEEIRLLRVKSFVTGGVTGAISLAAAQLGGLALTGPIGALIGSITAGAIANRLGQRDLKNSRAAYFLLKLR